MDFATIKNLVIAFSGLGLIEILQWIKDNGNIVITVIQIFIGLATIFYILVKARKTWYETPIIKRYKIKKRKNENKS